MKFFIAILLFIVLISFISTKELAMPKLTAPPETVLLKDSLYIDKLEVTNAMWQDFTNNWLLDKEGDTAMYKKMQPDSSVWYSLKIDYENYVKSYFKSATFSSYPVVGITYEQAVAYCEWCTERVNEYLEKLKDIRFRSVIYRLPTEAEWELAAAGKLDLTKFPYGYERIKMATKYDTSKMFNCYYRDIDSARNTEQNMVAPSNSGTPNLFGAYNMIGNVGEMVIEKGLSKGGFYDLKVESCKVKEQFSYKKPNRYLGFRCVCLVDNSVGFKNPKEGFKKPTKEQTKQPKLDKKTKLKKGAKGFQQPEDSTNTNPQ